MKVMVFDTETTGLPRFDRPSDHPSQPHLVQYTGCLFDDHTDEEEAFDTMMVKPNGWRIPAEISAIHGITHQMALADGVPLIDAVRAYAAMVRRAELIIGFNVHFDIRMMRISMLQCGISRQRADDFHHGRQKYDVMQKCTARCKIPPTDKMVAAGFGKKFKSPSLAEAMRILMLEELDDAHDSRADVLATMRLYQHLNRSKEFALA